MLRFSCSNCGAPIVVDEGKQGTAVVCSNCNGREPVPSTAAVVREPPGDLTPASQAAAFVAAAKRRASVEPQPPYDALHLAGHVLFVLGIIQVCASIALACIVSPYMLIGIVGGIITSGLGAAMHCLRNIAIDVWHIRHES